MNKAKKTTKRRPIDSSVAGSSKSQNTDESTLSSSNPMKNSKSSTRKRVNTSADPSEETTSKKRKIVSNVAGTSKRKVNENMDIDSTAQNSGSTIKSAKSVHDLPPEMLRTLLNHFTTDDLLKCRQVNHKWNELSSQILNHRADKVLRFRFNKEHFMRNIRTKHCDLMGSMCPDWYECNKKSLTDLLDCFKDCKRFPYTSFDFGDLAHFENEEMKKFLTIWGRQILCLKIKMLNPEKNAETLKKLLLEQIPNLNKLEIQCKNDDGEHRYSSVQVSTPILQSFALFQKFQLPKLEVLTVCTSYRQFRGIVESILTSACNLKSFVYNTNHSKRNNMRDEAVRDSITPDDLIMLQSLNKLQCLQAIEIRLSEDLVTYWKKSAKTLDLKLKTIHLSFGKIWEDQQLKLDATSVVNQLLESSKEVIETLAMEPMGLLPGVVFPRLEKLHTLDLWGAPYSRSSIKSTMFPQPFKMADVLPNLKELGTYVGGNHDYFPQSLTPMPSIEVLRMYGDTAPKNKEKLLKMTPNVKTFILADNSPFPEKQDFLNAFRLIVNNFTKLETFGWVIWKMTHHDLLYKLDAAMTGLPEDFCNKMSVKYRNKDKVSAKELASIELKRKHSSILDLKELKKMDVTFLFDGDCYAFREAGEYEMCDSDCEQSDCEGECGGPALKDDEAGYNVESDFYQTGFTKVSEFLAFKLMPNLKIRTHRRLD